MEELKHFKARALLRVAELIFVRASLRRAREAEEEIKLECLSFRDLQVRRAIQLALIQRFSSI
jgi:hypothetical protein